MKRFDFKAFALVAVLFFGVTTVQATDRGEEHKTDSMSRYDRRIHHYREHWQSLIPTHTKLHFYGNMGLVSAGFGWDYGRHEQWETDLYLGILTRCSGERAHVTFTLRQNYIPWSLDLSPKIAFEPLAVALYTNTVFGDDFWVREPDRYPKGYYGFSTKIRFNLAIGERFTFEIPRRFRKTARAVTFYYELTTNDFTLVSGVQNRYLTFTDYFSIGFGVKFQLF